MASILFFVNNPKLSLKGFIFISKKKKATTTSAAAGENTQGSQLPSPPASSMRFSKMDSFSLFFFHLHLPAPALPSAPSTPPPHVRPRGERSSHRLAVASNQCEQPANYQTLSPGCLLIAYIRHHQWQAQD